jgi:hypothetical protein
VLVSHLLPGSLGGPGNWKEVLKTAAVAESFRSDLTAAGRKGEALAPSPGGPSPWCERGTR